MQLTKHPKPEAKSFLNAPPVHQGIKKTISGRVDINNLLDRARKKKEKTNKKNLIFFGLFIALIAALGIFLSF